LKLTSTWSDPHGGFSLVELLIVMAVLGVVTGTALLRTNFTGGEGKREFERIVAFLRRQHARSLRSSEKLTVHFRTEEERILTRNDEGEIVDRLPVKTWSAQETSQITVSAWYGKQGRLTFRNESGEEKHLDPDWILGFVPEAGVDDQS
jgi:prepilin-type N-terminal cleavage/methylation domain-containing protein